MFILVFASLLSGKYMFIEASSPRKLNDRALLASEMLPAGSASCFHFWYSMYGHDIYILRVWVRQNSNGLQVPIFELKGQQSTSPQWLQGQAPLPTQSDSFSVSCRFFPPLLAVTSIGQSHKHRTARCMEERDVERESA